MLRVAATGGIKLVRQLTGLVRILHGFQAVTGRIDALHHRAGGIWRRRRRADPVTIPLATRDPDAERAIEAAREATARIELPRRSLVGATIADRYLVVEEIDHGGMGIVYHAEDLARSRPVALKMLHPAMTGDRDLVLRFHREIALLAAVDHRSVVAFFERSSHDGVPYYTMELAHGPTLIDWVAEARYRGDWLQLSDVAFAIRQAASGLEAIHATGFLHRDVKPSNLVIDDGAERAFLIDLGLAGPEGAFGDASGTPGYIAPETVRRQEESRATDVYGLAATAYVALTSRPPFGQPTETRRVLKRQLKGPPRPPSRRRPGLSTGIDELLRASLSADPRDRPATALEFADALVRLLA
jgi:serine/threonine-protein kinase